MEACPVPERRIRTNADLAAWSVELVRALRECNADKAALRQWDKASESED